MNHEANFDQPVAWEPTPEMVERAQLTKFIKQVGAHDFNDLYQKSVEDIEWFTDQVLKFLNIKFSPAYEKLLDVSDGIEWSRWCVGGGLNITEMCVDRWQTDEMLNQPAIIWEGEEGFSETLTYAELLEQVELCAAGLCDDGFGKGDAVGIHLPMIPETVVVLLAINRIGAIAVPVFSGYGAEAIVSRMNAVGAKALFTVNKFSRRGKQIMAFQVALEAAGKCPTIKRVYLVDESYKEFIAHSKEKYKDAKRKREEYQKLTDAERTEYNKKIELKRREGEQKFQERLFKDLEEKNVSKKEIERVRQEIADGRNQPIIIRISDHETFTIGAAPSPPKENVVQLNKYTSASWRRLLRNVNDETDFSSYIEPTLAEDPLMILYTSGTTGKPKGILHTHCGFPIKVAQDMAFGTDVGRGTRISWLTDIGWMMGPWLIYGALINGATICLYDGAPDYPNAERIWEFAAKHKVEVLGVSPTLIRSLMTHGDDLPAKHDLSSLRAFASTGEPWNPAPWWWLFEKAGKSKLPIINYSGGTEISGGILMGNPLLPIKPCSFPAPCLGIAADILDEKGDSLLDGKVGELAIKKPWIGMARGFWQDPERYLETYWNRFENVWVHGDWAMRDSDGHWFILGRSDDTLKIAGKRVGPAEVESLLVGHENVVEAAVIGIPDEIKGTAMVAFCVLTGSADILSASDAEADRMSALQLLETELKNLVAEAMGKPLKPSKVLFVSALPKTRNAKVMRRVIRAAYMGENAGDLSALENPSAVEEIQQLAIR